MTETRVLREHDGRVVRQTLVEGPKGRHVVSTVLLDKNIRFVDVFLGVVGNDPAMLEEKDYETMVFPAIGEDSFDTREECYLKRYDSYEEAEEGHEKIVQGLVEDSITLVTATERMGR